MTTNVADDDAARLAALIGDSDSADSAAEGAEPPPRDSPRDAGRAPTPEPEADGEERAPSAFLFGELCRVRERAAKSEVEAQALERKLSMAEDLRGVVVGDVCRHICSCCSCSSVTGGLFRSVRAERRCSQVGH